MEQTTNPSYKPLLNKRRCCHKKSSTPKQMESWNHLPEKHIIGWWSEPIWKILVKLDHLPQVEVKIKDVWKHHLDTYGNLMVPSPMLPPRNTSLWRDKAEPPWSSKALISLGRWLGGWTCHANLLRGTHIFTSPERLDRSAWIQIGTYHDVILRDLRSLKNWLASCIPCTDKKQKRVLWR